jgi:outer membrane protein OmpA-like peptidoglycan-associated protein
MITIRKTCIFLIASLLCFNFPLSYAFEAADDAVGASDSQLFKRYPRSKIDSYSQASTDDYLFALGATKTVNGVMALEYSERLAGSLTRHTYRSPDGEASDLAFEHFRSQLTALPHSLLFECHGRKCGSSNQWANRIFGVRKLYGPERYQHYLAAQLNTEKGPLFMALYSIQRGNKRVYTQLDLLSPDSNSAMSLDVNPDTILTVLKSEGVFNLRNLQFDKDDKLAADSKPRLNSVVAALNKNSRLKFYVVGHIANEGALDSLKARSLTRAESVLQALVEQGGNIERLSAQGVGPLAPIRKDSEYADRIGFVLQ